MKDIVTPERLVTVTQGATPAQIITLVLLGIIALAAVIYVVKWVVDTKLGTIPGDLAEIRKGQLDINTKLGDLRSELWSKDEVDNRISAAILKHTENCPHHKQ